MTLTTQDRITELERQVSILTRLAETSAILNSTIKLKALLSAIMDTAADIVRAEAASVLLWDSKSEQLVFAATTTATGQQLIGVTVPLEGSIAGSVFLKNEPVAVDDVFSDARHYSKIDEKTTFTTRSIIGVPMRSKNRVMGVLEAVNKRGRSWDEDDAMYLSILAAQAAVAIETAQLVSQLQKANENLAELDKLKSDFIAVASHELRTPLGVILGYAGFLQETEDPEVREQANRMVHAALQLRTIIQDMTNLRYLELHQIDLIREPTPLKDFLHAILSEMQDAASAQNHRLELLDVPAAAVYIDRTRIAMALHNIVHNAVRFTPPGGRITATVEIRKREAWIHITDTGIGLEREQLERIFEKFTQVEDHMTRLNGGLGIGLSIARAMIEAHDGRIWANSPGLKQGSTFTVALPLAERP